MNTEADLDIKEILGSTIPYTNRIIKGEDNFKNSTINQFSVLDELGEGAFGLVKLCKENETQQKFALKMYSKSVMKKQKDMKKDAVTG